MKTPPLMCRWDGEGFCPATAYWANRANRDLVVGELYQIVAHEERSASTHSHQFAWLNEAWQNLPEHLADLYPTPEHLRKRALIEAGYFTEELIDVGSNAGALRVASAFRSRDEFALVIVRGGFVSVRTPKSQSRRAMDKKTFQASKTAIMDVIAALLGTTLDALGKAEAA